MASRRSDRAVGRARAARSLLLISAMLATVLGHIAIPAAIAQVSDFQIVWVVIGEAATADRKRAARAGRQLFVASDLLSMSLENTKVERVDVEPVILEIGVGERLCLTALTMRAFGPDKEQIDGAPLSVAIRQDHKERLGLKRSRRDICMQPSNAGEYPVRMTSLLPAADGTMRGAQVFLRVKDLSSDP